MPAIPPILSPPSPPLASLCLFQLLARFRQPSYRLRAATRQISKHLTAVQKSLDLKADRNRIGCCFLSLNMR